MVALGVFGHLGCRGRAGSGGRGLRFVGGGGRTFARLQSGIHSRRHSVENSGRGTDRRGSGQPGDCTGLSCCCMRAASKPGAWDFGGPELPAPQAGLMATLALGIVGHDMAWPLVVVGILFGIAMDHDAGEESDARRGWHVLTVRNNIRNFCRRRVSHTRRLGRQNGGGFNRAQQGPRRKNAGVLVASGLIAGEALVGPGVGRIAVCASVGERPNHPPADLPAIRRIS